MCLFERRSGGEVVTSPLLTRKVGCSRTTMIRARCLRVKQHYPAQKKNQKNSMKFLNRGTTAVAVMSCTALVLVLSPVDKWSLKCFRKALFQPLYEIQSWYRQQWEGDKLVALIFTIRALFLINSTKVILFVRNYRGI